MKFYPFLNRGKMGWLVLSILAFIASPGPGSHDLVATVTVDGRNNCLETDYQNIAQRIHLEPGRYRLSLEGGGIIYGSQEVYRRRQPQNVLLDFDPAEVSVIYSAPEGIKKRTAPLAGAALFAPELHYTLSHIDIEVTAPTEIYAYLMDRRGDDNAGGVSLRVVRFNPNPRPHQDPLFKAKLVAEVWVDARRNCLVQDLRRIAQPIPLKPGTYHLRLGPGAIIYGARAVYRQRPAANVLLDFDPADVSVYDT